MAQVTEAAGRDYLAALLVEAGQGRLAGVPPLPERAAQLFGETGWLRQLARAAGGDTAPHGATLHGTALHGTAFRDSGLPEQFARAERAWRQRLGELLSELTRI